MFRRNEANSCYCVDGFACFKSGVLNMAPCKRTPERPMGAPLALSYPHFYQADPHYLNVSIAYKKTKNKIYLNSTCLHNSFCLVCNSTTFIFCDKKFDYEKS